MISFLTGGGSFGTAWFRRGERVNTGGIDSMLTLIRRSAKWGIPTNELWRHPRILSCANCNQDHTQRHGPRSCTAEEAMPAIIIDENPPFVSESWGFTQTLIATRYVLLNLSRRLLSSLYKGLTQRTKTKVEGADSPSHRVQ